MFYQNVFLQAAVTPSLPPAKFAGCGGMAGKETPFYEDITATLIFVRFVGYLRT